MTKINPYCETCAHPLVTEGHDLEVIKDISMKTAKVGPLYNRRGINRSHKGGQSQREVAPH